MTFEVKDLLDGSLSDEKADKFIEMYAQIPDNKIFSKDEDKEIRAQWLSFGTTLSACNKGHIVPPDFKPAVKEFEKAGYDVTKLSKEYKLSLETTYKDFKELITDDSKSFKNTSIEAYCKIYEFFSNATNIKFINRLKNDPNTKKNSLGIEDWNIDSIESYLNETSYVKSEEGFPLAANILKIAPTLKDAVMGATCTVASMNNILNFLLLLMIVVSVLIIILIVIHLAYTSELNEILVKMNGGDKKIDKNEVKKLKSDAALEIWNNTNPVTKNLVIKPAMRAEKITSKIAEKSYDFFDKTLKNIKNGKSKEDVENENTEDQNAESENKENQSEEAIDRGIKTIVGAVGTVAAGIIGATFYQAAIVALIILLIFNIKSIVYFVYKLRLRVGTFFKDQSEMLEINYERLQEIVDNPNTSESEKQRIAKVIQKQKNISQSLARFSQFVYKSQNEAAMEARDAVRAESKIDYTREIDKYDSGEEKTRSTISNDYDFNPDPMNPNSLPGMQPQEPQSTGGNKPTIIF